MRAVVLAAGEGRRLRPLTYAASKPLLQLGPSLMIDYALGPVRAAADVLSNLTILVGSEETRRILNDHLRDQRWLLDVSVHAGFGSGAVADLSAFLSGNLFKGSVEPVLVGVCDNAWEDDRSKIAVDVGRLLSTYLVHADDALAVVGQSFTWISANEDPSCGVLEVVGGKVVGFREKGRPSNVETAFVAPFVLTREGVRFVQSLRLPKEEDELGRVVERMIGAGTVFAVTYDSRIEDVGTLKKFRRFRDRLEQAWVVKEEEHGSGKGGGEGPA